MATSNESIDKEKIISNFVSIFVALLSGLTAVYVTIGKAELKDDPKHSNYEVRVIKDKVEDARRDIVSITQRVDNLEAIDDTTNAPVALEVKKLNKLLEQTNNRLSGIEKIIVQDPLKSLEIPFLRKDLENIRDVGRSDIEKIRQDIDKIYSLIIGSIVTLVIAILTPLVQNIISYRRDLKSRSEIKTVEAEKANMS